MPALSAADFAHWDRERQEFGYYLDDGRWIVSGALTGTSAP
jgi:hypothetical protein